MIFTYKFLTIKSSVMKHPATLILLFTIASCFIGATSPNTIKSTPSTVLLVYVGNLSGPTSLSFGIHIEIDSTIGYRYEVVAERGTAVLSHTVLLYKFAQPNQSIVYNYLTKKSFVNSRSASSTDPRVSVIGTETIDSFTCTHLQYANPSAKVQADYWMSKQVPGFSMMIGILQSTGTDALSQLLNGTIFQWGGLVKWTTVRTASPGGSSTMKLQEAETGLNFPASDFEVPTN
jgi:hypothetical protein